MKRGLLAIAVASAAIATNACSDASSAANAGADARTIARTDRRASAIQGGSPDPGDKFAVAIVDSDNGICSGTLIAPNLVLTARHCVANDSGGATVDCTKDRFMAPAAASTLRVSTDDDTSFANAPFHATKVLVPSDTLFCGNDIALIVLAELVPAAIASPATPAIDPPLTDRATYGSKLTAIGFGTTQPGGNDDGFRHKRPNVAIACIPGDTTIGCDPLDFDMTPAELAAGNGLCEGDSGSGAYEPSSLAAGKPVVMGVLSRAAEDAGQCSDSVYVRTDTASAFLVNGAKEAATIGKYAVPAWADPTAVQPDAGVADSGTTDPGTDPEDAGADAATPPPGATTTTTSGCSMAASSPSERRSSREAFVMIAAALALVVSRARSRRSAARV